MRSFTVVFIPVGLGLLERNRIVNKVENRTIIIKYIFCANLGIYLLQLVSSWSLSDESRA